MAIISSILAKISTIALVFATILWIFRIMVEKGMVKKEGKSKRFYEWLKKRHQAIGEVLILSALVHGIVSSDKLFSLNWGTICWIMCILLGATAAFKNNKNEKNWFMLHRGMSIASFVLMVVHIVSVNLR